MLKEQFGIHEFERKPLTQLDRIECYQQRRQSNWSFMGPL